MKVHNETAANRSETSLLARTVTGMLWLFTGSSAQAVFRMLVTIILARLLTPEDFGLVGAVLVITGLSQLVAQLGMGPAIIQRSNLDSSHIRTAFTVSAAVGLLLGILFFLAAPAIADFYREPRLIDITRVMALGFPISGLTVVTGSLLRRELRFKALTLSEVASYVVGYGLVGLSLALWRAGPWALVFANLARHLCEAVLFAIVQPHSKSLGIDRRAFRELIHYGGGFTLARLFNYLALQGDNLVIGRALGVGALGLYGRAYQLIVMPINLFGAAIDQVLFPVMAKVQDDKRRLTLAYRRGVSLIALVFAPFGVSVLVLAPELIAVVYGARWVGAVVPFQILAVTMLFRASYKMSDSLARATGAVYRRALYQAVYAVLVIAGASLGQRWGLGGVSVGVALAITVNFFLMAQLAISQLELGWREFLSLHLPALRSAALVLATALLCTNALRAAELPAVAVLFLASLAVGAVQALLIVVAPRSMLGQDGDWALGTLKAFTRKRMGFILRTRGA